MTGIDPELLGRLRGAPLGAEEWRTALAEHEKFVRATRPGASSRWQVLDVSGLPLAVWTGGSSERGKQLNLNLGNLSGLALDAANLTAAALPGVFAENVSFRGATLRLALLSDARLDGADFTGADLDLADFSRSSLRNASFRSVTGTETDFENCDLRGADFTGSQLLRPKLTGARLEDVKGLN